jgi:type III secretion protein D
VVAGDVVNVGPIEFQFDRTYPAAVQDDSMFAESIMPDDTAPTAAPPVPPSRPTARWAGAAAMVGAALLLLGLTAWDGAAAVSGGGDGLNVRAVEQAVAGFAEVEVVALHGGELAVRGHVESKARRQALLDAVQPFGPGVTVNVQAADEIVEQARRYVSDPAISIAYTGRGRLLVSGVADDASLQQKIRRLGEDLHPTVLVTDRVQYREKPDMQREADMRARWTAWQGVLPSRLVSITEDANGTRHIQLANGSRYYEGSVMRSGAELKHIGVDGLQVTAGQDAKNKDK